MLGDGEDDAMRYCGGDGDGRMGIVNVCATGSGACSSFNRRAGSLVHASAKLRCATYGATMIRPSMLSGEEMWQVGAVITGTEEAHVVLGGPESSFALGVAGSLLRIKGVGSGVIQ